MRRFLPAVLSLSRLELVLALRRAENLLITAAIPLLLLVFFGSTSVLTSTNDRPIDTLLPGVLALAVMSASFVGLGISTAFERQQGVLKRLGGTPLPRSGLLAAKLLALFVIQLAQAVLLCLVAAVLFGWRPGSQGLLAVPAIVLGSLCFAALGLLLAGTLRAEAVLALANGLYLVFLLLGDMVFSLSQLPSWLVAIAGWLPAAAFAQLLRAALLDGYAAPALALFVLLGWAALAAVAAARLFRWE